MASDGLRLEDGQTNLVGGDLSLIFVSAGVLRAVLIGISVLQDMLAEVAYTDVDYQVFSEAAESVTLGLSPYAGRTPLLEASETRYRYTPLLAYLLTPNVWLHPAWGKVLFSAIDLVAARHLARYLRAHARSGALVRAALAFWLFNPFIFTISTRGSSDTIVVCLVYGMLDALQCRRDALAACLFGLAAHCRVYPIVYGPSLLLAVAKSGTGRSWWRRMMSYEAARFFAISAGSFLALLGLFSWVYGSEFIHASYLYHASRVDTKHNFSLYFYPLRWLPGLARLSLPIQLAACGAVFLAARDAPLPLALLLLTLCFVALNRVITAQYFMWWLALLPPALPFLAAPPAHRLRADLPVDGRILKALLVWAAAEVLWLLCAYLLEFRGLPVAWLVWAASLAFAVAEARVALAVWRCAALSAGDRER